MGSQEEAEWILERLIARLGEELRAAREAHHRSAGQ
jgi:potassium channel subfamily K